MTNSQYSETNSKKNLKDFKARKKRRKSKNVMDNKKERVEGCIKTKHKHINTEKNAQERKQIIAAINGSIWYAFAFNLL